MYAATRDPTALSSKATEAKPREAMSHKRFASTMSRFTGEEVQPSTPSVSDPQIVARCARQVALDS